MAGLTLAQIRTQCKQRADMENSTFVADSEWTAYINDSLCELHDIILSSDPQSIVTKATITVTSATDNYALPSDFYKVNAAYFMQSGIRYALERCDFHDLGNGIQSISNLAIGGPVFRYALAGSLIYFYPVPSASAQVELWYFPQRTRLSSDSDVVSYPVVNGWEQFIVLGAVIKAKMKEEDDIAAELNERTELKQRIILMATGRDTFNAPKVRDAYGATSRNRRYNMVNGIGSAGRYTRWW